MFTRMNMDAICGIVWDQGMATTRARGPLLEIMPLRRLFLGERILPRTLQRIVHSSKFTIFSRYHVIDPAVKCLIDFSTGKGITYRSTSQTDLLDDTSDYRKFPDLVTASNVCASHAHRTSAYPGPKYLIHSNNLFKFYLIVHASRTYNFSIILQVFCGRVENQQQAVMHWR